MRFIRIILKIVFFPIKLIWNATKPRHFPNGKPISVRSPLVIDGDTFWYKGDRYRIWGIDAPEMSESGGMASKQHLEKLTNLRNLHFIPRATDVYGRTVVQVFCGRGDIGEAMVQDGYAISRVKLYAKAAAVAAKNKRGLCKHGPISDPAKHRRAKAV